MKWGILSTARINRPFLAGARQSDAVEILAVARSEHRALVTDNLRDFRPLHAEAITPGGPGHYGMIFIPGGYRRTRADIGKIVAALEAVLAADPGEADLADGEAWL